MSDLGSGRAHNGGARTGGPVPVSGQSSGLRTPRQIMDARNAREQRRQEEQKAEEQSRLAEERRRSAERRAAAVGGGAPPRVSAASSQYTPDLSAQQAGFDGRASGGGRVAGSNVLGDPTGRTTQDYSTSRARVSSVSQPDQPRAAPTSAAGSRRTQQGQSAPRPSSSSTAQAAPPQQADSGAQRGTSSSFPHAFERWETLSSHWEGLTSYWLHKLEQNTEQIRDTVPNAVTLNRQITDLSAAGANLFHAVVELQRLRASSERKFQRWFFETRADNERNREVQAQIENQLKLERSAREEAARNRADASIQTENARREVAEMRRELMISKDEARRAWEELGRRNQESLETAQSLKEGRVTIVSGVQVVPYSGGPSRTGSASQRPTTREGQPPYGSTGMASAAGAAGLQSPGEEERYYQQEASPTNTDPFMESSQPAHPLHHEPGRQTLSGATYQGYSLGGTPTTTSTAQTAIPLAGQRPSRTSASPVAVSQTSGPSMVPVTTQEAQRFYQHGPQETFLHSAQSSAQPVAPGPSEGSYIGSDGDTDYILDAAGNVQYDAQGRPLTFRRPRPSPSAAVPTSQPEDEDDEDDALDSDAIRREQQLAAQYRSEGGLPEAPSVPTSTSAATYVPPSTTASAAAGIPGGATTRPDYEGDGYSGWEALQTRHHHPTRLSDVLEEEEERSSRRTAE